ncbi:hypothetical protein BH20ACT22_BH20ACT22_13920 [soil metagenome]|jgi:hypothetical protein
MEPGEVIWEGKVGATPLRVGVPFAGRIIAEWDSPTGRRDKVSESVEQFERTVLFQLLLSSGVTDEKLQQEIVAAIQKAQQQRPRRMPEPEARPRRRNPKVRQHRRSRRPPRRI